ncbi:MAG: hypothetical protein JXB00_09145 [Bacteroidales bacterium]|nr:hypothetical protein [Bacteroidales bacterium]
MKYIQYHTTLIKKTLFFLLFLISISCNPYTVTTISVLLPGNAPIPSDVKSISLAMAQNEHSMPAGRLDSINNLKLDPDFNYYILAKDMLYGMRDVLALSPKFDTVIISKGKNFGAINSNRGLNWNQIIKVLRNDSCDALLLVDHVLLEDSLSMVPFETSCFVEYKMKSSLHYSVFYPKLLDVMHSKSENHSLVFSEVGYDCDMALNQLPDGGDLIVQMFYESGQNAVDGMAPLWQDDIKRVYYANSNKLLRQGAWYAKRNAWIDAAEYWRKAVDVNNKNTSARAAFNMALVCELENMPEASLNWIEISDSLKSTNLSRQYKKIIETRLKHYGYLNEQMGFE